MTQWKHAERRIAEILGEGAVRVPVTGRSRGSAPDIAHPWLSLEVKHRKSLPSWMINAVNQAVASDSGQQLPMVIFHQQHQRYEDSVCLLRLSDFVEWFGQPDLSTDEE